MTLNDVPGVAILWDSTKQQLIWAEHRETCQNYELRMRFTWQSISLCLDTQINVHGNTIMMLQLNIPKIFKTFLFVPLFVMHNHKS